MTPQDETQVVGIPEPEIEVQVVSDAPVWYRGRYHYKKEPPFMMTVVEAENFGTRYLKWDRLAGESLTRQWMKKVAATRVKAVERSDIPVSIGRTSKAIHVGWYHDTYGELGGAEASNAELIRVGRDLGFDIEHIHAQNFEASRHDNDVAVLCNLRHFGKRQKIAINEIVLEHRVPFLWRDHDYAFCRFRGLLPCYKPGAKCSPLCNADEWKAEKEHVNRLARRASVRVFISESQLKLYEQHLGPFPETHLLLWPPINPHVFYPSTDVQRVPKLAVCTPGRLDERKGRSNVLAWATAHPDWIVQVYVRGGLEGEAQRADSTPVPPNVKILPTVPLAQLRNIYARASLCLFLPTIPEPAGRTPFEAAACGCPVETNENWGAASFHAPLDNPAALADRIRESVGQFWKTVESVAKEPR